MSRPVLFMLALLLPAPFVAGCNSAEAAIDCNSICKRYKDCFDSGYDADSCATRCQNSAKDDRNYRDKADSCNTCLGDRSCVGSFLSCTDNCVGVVP